MRVKVEIWTIERLFELSEKINEQPEYQRGEVWKDNKKSLLIDSILRGIDIPKIFLHKLKDNHFDYAVSDGQQRITAILKFKADELKLRKDVINGLDLNQIETFEIGGLKYSELPSNLRRRFDNYELTIALIDQATNNEIRTLFGRLQLGETLTPAEKRNAIISSTGNYIDSVVLNHDFFVNSKIPKSRFKQQDYLSHIIALIAYNNVFDLKAELLEKLYLENPIKLTQIFQKKISYILDFLHLIDKESKVRIINKFAFIDMFWLLYTEYDSYSTVEIEKFARKFEKFEKARLDNNLEPEKLLIGEEAELNKDLYTYIMSFNYSGSKPLNINNRNRVFRKVFKRYLQA
jgi:uncharacterized protein with ParB-like and HNH nuclease domain